MLALGCDLLFSELDVVWLHHPLDGHCARDDARAGMGTSLDSAAADRVREIQQWCTSGQRRVDARGQVLAGAGAHPARLAAIDAQAPSYDLQIQLNLGPGGIPGNLRGPPLRTELNIGFFLLRATTAAQRLVGATVAKLANNLGWDQALFSQTAWEQVERWDFQGGKRASGVRQGVCHHCNASHPQHGHAHGGSSGSDRDALSMLLLSVWHYPTGGITHGLHRTPVVSIGEYRATNSTPVIMHCTGRTGVVSKQACMKEWRAAFHTGQLGSQSYSCR